MKIFRRISILLCASVLTACGPADESKDALPYTNADGETVLRVGIRALPPFLGNPQASMNAPTIFTYAAIFDALTYVGHSGEVKPWLATSWEMTSDTTWVFQLREGVTFSNGAPFSAETVVDVIDYLISPEASVEVVAGMLDSIESAWATGPLTVEITTKRPNPVLHREVSTLRIHEPGQWERLGRQGFAREPVGTGPFEVEEWAGNKVLLKAFKGSWRPPKFDRLELTQITETASRVQAITSGQMDLVIALNPEDAETLEQAGKAADVVAGSGTFGFTFVLNPDYPGFGPANAPLMNPVVRRALNYAVDKRAITEQLMAGLTTPTGQPAPPFALGFNPDVEPYPYDPDKARALLAEAGYPDGFTFAVDVVPNAIAGGNAYFQKAQEDLAKVGVTMELTSITIPQYLKLVHQGDTDSQAFMMDYPTAPSMDALRAMRLHSCLWKTPWLCDPGLQARIDAAMSTPSLEDRDRLAQEIMAEFHDEAYALWLMNLVRVYGRQPGLKGFSAEGLFIKYDQLGY